MNSINFANSTDNLLLTQASTAAKMHKVDVDAAASCNSPLAPCFGGLPEPATAPRTQVSLCDINRDIDDLDEVEMSADLPGRTKLSMKQRRRLRRFMNFVGEQ